jgi:hypothetical protein
MKDKDRREEDLLNGEFLNPSNVNRSGTAGRLL